MAKQLQKIYGEDKIVSLESVQIPVIEMIRYDLLANEWHLYADYSFFPVFQLLRPRASKLGLGKFETG